MYHNNIVGMLKIHVCPLNTGEVVRLPGADSPGVLHKATLRITLTVPGVVDTENLSFLLDPNSITKTQS